MKIQYKIATLTAAMSLACAGTALAGDPVVYGNNIAAQPSQSMSNVTMTVTGPNGFHSQSFSASGAPSASLAKSGPMADGLYRWQTTGSSSKMIKANPMGLDNGRGENAREFMNESVTESGYFRVVNGVVASQDGAEEEQSRGAK